MDLSLPEELVMVRDTVREFVQNELVPIEQEVLVREKGGMRSAAIPREKRQRLNKLAVEQGLWAMTVPESLGGGGLNTLGACLVAEELGKSFVDFDFGDIPPILYKANTEQQGLFLRPLIAGEKECATALREPGTEDIRLRAIPEGDEWRLTGRKIAHDADIFLLFAATDSGMTCFLVEIDRDGVSHREDEVILQDVHIPTANVLGRIGGALELAKDSADCRRVRAAARRSGLAARLLEISSQYARDWKALGQPLSIRPAVRRHLADMAVELEAARGLVYRAACELDQNRQAAEPSLHASVFAQEMLWRAVDRTIQVYGGPMHAPDLPLRRVYGDRSSREGEGILELERFQIAHGLLDGGRD